MMPAVSPPACLWCFLFCLAVSLQHSYLRLAYVTHNSLYYYSCAEDPQPCSLSSLTDCSCEDLQLSMLYRIHLHSSPAFRVRRLTVWYTSASNTARLLNNSDVRHLTLIHCGAGGSRGPASHGPSIQEGYFAVQQLEHLTVVNLPTKPILEGNNARNTELERENGEDLSTFIYNRVTDIDQDLNTDSRKDLEFLDLLPPQIQDIFPGREIGAAYHEQARLGIIYSSVLQSGLEVKAYTIQTHIGSDGLLPFPNLHLPRLPETSVIFVSFVY